MRKVNIQEVKSKISNLLPGNSLRISGVISSNAILEELVSIINQSPQIKKLVLYSNDLDDDAMVTLAKLKHITTLESNSNSFKSTEKLAILLQNPTITDYILDETHFKDETLKHLIEHKDYGKKVRIFSAWTSKKMEDKRAGLHLCSNGPLLRLQEPGSPFFGLVKYGHLRTMTLEQMKTTTWDFEAPSLGKTNDDSKSSIDEIDADNDSVDSLPPSI